MTCPALCPWLSHTDWRRLPSDTVPDSRLQVAERTVGASRRPPWQHDSRLVFGLPERCTHVRQLRHRFGAKLHAFLSPMPTVSPPHTRCRCALFFSFFWLVAQACRALTGACNPMLCPIHVARFNPNGSIVLMFKGTNKDAELRPGQATPCNIATAPRCTATSTLFLDNFSPVSRLFLSPAPLSRTIPRAIACWITERCLESGVVTNLRLQGVAPTQC